MLNLPSSPVLGAVLPVSSSTRGWTLRATLRISSGFTWSSSRIWIAASMAGCMTMPQAKGL